MVKRQPVPRTRDTIPISYRVLTDPFRRSLAAENKSPHTIDAYLRGSADRRVPDRAGDAD